MQEIGFPLVLGQLRNASNRTGWFGLNLNGYVFCTKLALVDRDKQPEVYHVASLSCGNKLCMQFFQVMNKTSKYNGFFKFCSCNVACGKLLV